MGRFGVFVLHLAFFQSSNFTCGDHPSQVFACNPQNQCAFTKHMGMSMVALLIHYWGVVKD